MLYSDLNKLASIPFHSRKDSKDTHSMEPLSVFCLKDTEIGRKDLASEPNKRISLLELDTLEHQLDTSVIKDFVLHWKKSGTGETDKNTR